MISWSPVSMVTAGDSAIDRVSLSPIIIRVSWLFGISVTDVLVTILLLLLPLLLTGVDSDCCCIRKCFG